MKTYLKRMALFCALCMAAILPNCAFAQVATYSIGGQQTPTYSIGPSYQPAGNYYGMSQNATTNQNVIVIGGTSGSAFQFILENRLRAMMAKIGVVSNTYQLTGTADLSYADKGFALGQDRGALGIRWHKATVNVHLELVTVDNGFMADVSLTKTLDWNIAGVTNSGAGSFGTGRQAAENEFLYQAGSQALTSLVSQMQIAQKVIAASQPVTRVSGLLNLVFLSGQPTSITIPVTNPVGMNDQIWFVNTASQVTGKYTVLSLNAQTAVLEQVQGFQSVEPQNGDGFAIVYPK